MPLLLLSSAAQGWQPQGSGTRSSIWQQQQQRSQGAAAAAA
jgi:hypothetical protein